MGGREYKVPVDQSPHTLRHGSLPGELCGSYEDVGHPGVNLTDGPASDYSDKK